MNISSIYGKHKNAYSTYLYSRQQNTKGERVSSKRDSIEISEKVHKLNEAEEKITASSGKDTLGITKGNKENSYIVHFSDSAMVSRAVSRGYITVNGVDIELTEETKQQLLKVDKEANAAREKAYYDYVMQHEMAVAKQQSEAWKKSLDGMPDGLKMLLEYRNTVKC